MNKYKVEVKHVFDVTLFIEAENEEDVYKQVEEDYGGIKGNLIEGTAHIVDYLYSPLGDSMTIESVNLIKGDERNGK